MGSTDKITSPSFTVKNEYRANKLTLHHFDFYRLRDPGILRHELAEVMQDPQAVVVIEWPAIVGTILTSPHLILTLQQIGETGREIDIDYPKNYKYLFNMAD